MYFCEFVLDGFSYGCLGIGSCFLGISCCGGAFRLPKRACCIWKKCSLLVRPLSDACNALSAEAGVAVEDCNDLDVVDSDDLEIWC